ncbi:NAD(P)-dependent oxidoreductase [Candidatus Purcelliella pentastirinorum]|uniref:NAD(P)-dependent oxidoreductase n=1 Tax=Candidatus Purcelliella pentastirinorum TaxID=472834 RepID=UPI0039F69343
MLKIKTLLCDLFKKCKKNKDKFVSLKTIIDKSNIISLYVTLLNNSKNKTLHLFNKNRINLLKKNTILINTSKGEIINNKYLLKFLKEKKIST